MKAASTGFGKARSFAQVEIDAILNAGKVTRQEHLYLTTALLADQNVSDRDRGQINHILEAVRLGKLKLVD